MAALEQISGDASLLFATATVVEKGVEAESNGDSLESLFSLSIRELRRALHA